MALSPFETLRSSHEHNGVQVGSDGLVASDVTTLLEALRRAEAKYRDIFENAVEGIYQTTSDGRILNFNPAFARIYGYDSAVELLEAFAEGLFTLYADVHRRAEFVRQMKADGVVKNFESQVRHRDGSLIWVSENARAVHAGSELLYFEGTIEDITKRKLAEEALRRSEQKLSLHVQHTPLAVIEWNLAGEVTEWNPAAEGIFGYTRAEALGSHAFELIVPESARASMQTIWADLLAQTGGERSTNENRTKSGQIITCEWYNTALIDETGNVIGVASSALDISKRVEVERRLLYEASHDSLTGLPNRALFVDRLMQSIRRAKRHPSYCFAVLFLDLDRFKIVNDSLGHMIGDQLLVEISERLERCLRSGDTIARIDEDYTVARLGGDEFTILLDDLHDARDALRIAERIQTELTEPFLLDGNEVFTTASIGIALSDPRYEQPEDLLRDADIAMYRAKAHGKAQHVVFDAAMHATAMSILQVETDLRRAVERKEFVVHYQPVVKLDTGALMGFEALLRWKHPERGIIAPTDFIPIAEETGLIVPIGEWILREACQQLRQWRAELPADHPLSVSVNLSSRQLKQPDLVQVIDRILKETGVEPCHIRLEITESVVMENAKSTVAMLDQVRRLGVQLGIDDFGTGYSSLSYLHRFPIDLLKIDRSFVMRIGQERENLEIVRTIVTLAHNLGMEITAEGVETLEHSHQLRDLECEYAQGFLFSKPLCPPEAGALVAQNTRW